MSDDNSTSTDLFAGFDLPSTRVEPKNTHIRFPDDDDDDEEAPTKNEDENSIVVIDEIGSPTVAESDPVATNESEFVEMPKRFLRFLDNFAPSDLSFESKVDFLMDACSEKNSLKEIGEHGGSSGSFVVDRTKYDLGTFKEPFTGEESLIASNVSDSPKIGCFNCEGEHSLDDCSLPKDFEKIRRNRNSFRKLKGDRDSKRRYDDKPQFGQQFKPGVISDNLRNALLLEKHQIPPWIYQMRYLGYPPGYLKEAICEPSRLVMFDDNGVEITPSKKPPPKVSYDANKIIEYPGFNTPPPKHCIDEFATFRVPPIQPHHLKSEFFGHLNRLAEKINSETKQPEPPVSYGSVELMDVSQDDDFAPPLPPGPPPPPPRPSSNEIDKPLSKIPSSPTISELESQRAAILKQLGSSTKEKGMPQRECSAATLIIDDTSNISSCSSTVDVDSAEVVGVKIVDLVDVDSPTADEVVEIVEEDFSTNGRKTGSLKRQHSAKSIHMTMGTPAFVAENVPKPSLAQFRQGVQEFQTRDETVRNPNGGMNKLKELFKKAKFGRKEGK